MHSMLSVVVTGLGVVAPNGVGTRDFWAATRSGIDRVGRVDPEGYPARVAAEWALADAGVNPDELRNLWHESGRYAGGGLDAVAAARRRIRQGTRLVVSGALDPVEGGAILVLESATAAHARDANVYGLIAGYGATVDPQPGRGREALLRKAIELALADAGVPPSDVDMVLADAAAVPELDRVEAAAITSVFGPRGVPVTAPKTMTGRQSAGAAPLELAAAFLAMEEGLIPPTMNVVPAAEYGLDLVRARPRAAEVCTALVLARGSGGVNSAMLVQAADQQPRPVIDLTSWRRKERPMSRRRPTPVVPLAGSK